MEEGSQSTTRSAAHATRDKAQSSMMAGAKHPVKDVEVYTWNLYCADLIAYWQALRLGTCPLGATLQFRVVENVGSPTLGTEHAALIGSFSQSTSKRPEASSIVQPNPEGCLMAATTGSQEIQTIFAHAKIALVYRQR